MKKETTFPTGNLQAHPLAETVPGEMNPEEFAALCLSIKADGLGNPIVLFEGKILDGRARYAACKETKTKVEAVEFAGDEKKAIALVMDNNLHRRQLNSMQKALVAARMPGVSQKDAAAAVGVGVATVNLAVRLLNSKNAPLIKRAEHGDATRAEIDEILFDRAASQKQVPVGNGLADLITATAGAMHNNGNDDGDDLIGNNNNNNNNNNKKKNNVVPIRASTKGIETEANKVVQQFKALDAASRKAFCEMAWAWLEPILGDMGKLVPAKKKKRA